MTTQVIFIDRDAVIAAARAEQEQRENVSEISKLVRQITKARQELHICEANLAAIEESLTGKSKS